MRLSEGVLGVRLRGACAGALALSLLLTGQPAAAGTDLRSQLADVARRLDAAYTREALLEAKLRNAQRARRRTAARLDHARDSVGSLVRSVYMSGAGPADPTDSVDVQIHLDRLLYTELAARAEQITIETLRARIADMRATIESVSKLRAQHARVVAELRRDRARLDSLFAAERRLASTSTIRRLATQRSTRDAGPSITGSGPLFVCPVDRPRAYTNDFGAPRGGGTRRHEGIDILAPAGTPIRAPFNGQAVARSSSLGGLSVRVYGARGYVFNAHLSAYAKSGSVRAGDIIGYVGNSGNASGGAPHNHFEWHPGNGAAVNPYHYLNAVCG